MLNECNGCEYKCSLSHIDICTLGSPCPHQRSTPMTNEEWFCTIPTEEKAAVLDLKFNSTCRLFTYNEIVKWLKEIHDDNMGRNS